MIKIFTLFLIFRCAIAFLFVFLHFKSNMGMMKKIALFAAAVMMAWAVDAQLVVGLQGGYYTEKNVNSWNVDMSSRTTWLGGLQVGYQITPKLYFGVMGGYLSSTTSRLLTSKDTLIDGMNRTITNIADATEQEGWTVQPILRYELFKYGNMHFNMMLQGSIRNMGYTTGTHSYNNWSNNKEFIENDPMADSISSFSWSVSMRPTLTYEFSKHLSAELSLDFLSVGYVSEKVTHEGSKPSDFHMVDGVQVQDVETTTRFYGGLNTMMETLRWESPMLRLGFNYTF